MQPSASAPSRSPLTLSDAEGLRGVFPALFTPLKADDPKRLRNSIDFDKARRIIDDLIGAGVTGLVPVGTTGQSSTLSHDQHVEFIRFVCDYAGGRVPIIAGAGSNCTRESIEMIERIHKAVGREMAVLCVTGYYNNPTQDGLALHFKTVARETGAKIVIYNVPGRTASYLEPETLIELAAEPRIIGLKQAVDFRNPGKFRDDTARVIRETEGRDFAVVSGEDDGFNPLLLLGGRGLITATGNIPEAASLFLRVLAHHGAGEAEKAKACQAEADGFARFCFARKNPIPLGAYFNSPLYQPLASLRETKDGEKAWAEMRAFMEKHSPAMAKYHG